MITGVLVVSFMLVSWCHILESSPAVGVVGGVVNMNITISDRAINIIRNVMGPNNVVLLDFYSGMANPGYITTDVTYTGNISDGFVSFTLSNLTTQSAGIYQYVFSKGSVGTVSGGEQYLIIAESPSTPVITGLSQQAVAGRDYKLNCSAVSRSEKPGHNLTMFTEWKRNGVNIMADTKYGVDGTILTFRNLSRTDNAVSLTCIAFEDQRVKSPESIAFLLNVYYGPDSITLSPSQMAYDLPENSSLNVNCSADCVPSCQYRWTGPGVNYPDKTGILSISKISRSQAGVITCTAYNPNITSNSATAAVSVTVQYPPVVSITSRNGTYNDTDIALTCSAHGVPEKYIFTLTHHSFFTGQMIRHPSFDNVSTGVLIYRFSNFMDTGIYTCTVNNGIADYIDGSVNKSVSETVWIKGPPNETSSNTIFHAEKGQSGRLAIEFYNSLLDPSVTWYRDRNQSLEKLDSSDKYNIYISNTAVTLNFYSVSIQQPGFSAALEIRNVTPDDFGYYQVNVRNSVGVMSPRVLVLRPKGPPDVPHDVHIVHSSISTSSVGVEWLSGFYGGFDQAFTIEYREHMDTSWTKSSEEVFGGMTQDEYFNVTVRGLHQETMYLFRMYAWNSYNRGEYSVVINATTTADIKGEKIPGKESDKVIIGSVVGTVVLVGFAVVVGVVIVKWRRMAKLHSDGTQQNQIHTTSVSLDAASGQDYERLHINGTEANAYLQLNGIKLEANRNYNTRSPEIDSYEALHPYTNNDIQMYSSLKIPKIATDSEKVYENTRINETD